MPDGEFFNVDDLPSWHQYAMGAQSVLLAEAAEDPEDTLMVQLTLPEIAALFFGLSLMTRLFPELYEVSTSLRVKMQELSNAQEYFTRQRGEEDDDE